MEPSWLLMLYFIGSEMFFFSLTLRGLVICKRLVGEEMIMNRLKSSKHLLGLAVFLGAEEGCCVAAYGRELCAESVLLQLGWRLRLALPGIASSSFL